MDARTAKHADALRRGLTKLGPTFFASICYCEGHGEIVQHYNVGCGGGFIRMMGPHDFCGGRGLLQGDQPAPLSVLNQVLVAGEPT